MSVMIKISDDLIHDAGIYCKTDKQSIDLQIEHWARIGKCAEKNPDLTYNLIMEILTGLEELEHGNSSEYKFG